MREFNSKFEVFDKSNFSDKQDLFDTDPSQKRKKE